MPGHEGASTIAISPCWDSTAHKTFVNNPYKYFTSFIYFTNSPCQDLTFVRTFAKSSCEGPVLAPSNLFDPFSFPLDVCEAFGGVLRVAALMKNVSQLAIFCICWWWKLVLRLGFVIDDRYWCWWFFVLDWLTNVLEAYAFPAGLFYGFRLVLLVSCL